MSVPMLNFLAVMAMTQREAQQRIERLGLAVAIILALIFVGVLLHHYRKQPFAPPPVQLPKEPPDVMLLITANRQGKLEVCGCPGKRAEDLSKVASLLKTTAEQNRRRGTKVCIVEGGDFVGEPEMLPYLLKAYRLMGYQCVSLSPRDAKRFQTIRRNANGLSLLPPSSDSVTHLSVFRVKAKGVTVQLVNLGQPNLKDKQGWQPLLQALKALRSPNSILIGLVYLDSKTATQLVGKLGGIIDALLVDDNLSGPEEASFVALGGMASVAKKVSGVQVISLPQDRAQALSVMVWVNKRRGSCRLEATLLGAHGQPDEPQVKKIVNEYYARRQEHLEREIKQLMGIALKKDYVSPEFCGKCHQAQYEQWLTTKHAHAIETLKKRNQLVKECLTCHSLEFRMRGVFTETEKRGVECVDCHTDLTDPATARLHGLRPGERPTTKTVQGQVCVTCHDRQNSPNFNEQTYMPKVTH